MDQFNAGLDQAMDRSLDLLTHSDRDVVPSVRSGVEPADGTGGTTADGVDGEKLVTGAGSDGLGEEEPVTGGDGDEQADLGTAPATPSP